MVTKPRIRKPQEVHPVFALFTVIFTFKFSPDVFCSPLSFSPSLALVDPRKKNGCFTGQCAHVLFIHASFSLLLPALSAEQIDRERDRESCASRLFEKLEGKHYSEM